MRTLISKSNSLVLLLKHDRNVRFSFLCIFIVISISSALLTFKLEGRTYNYSLGDIVKEDIRVHRDILYTNEEETRIKQEKAAQASPLIFDRDPSILTEKLRVMGILFNNLMQTIDETRGESSGNLKDQLDRFRDRLPRYLHYNEEILIELLNYHNPEYIKKAILKTLIYIYEQNQVGILEIPYSNPLNIDNKNIIIRTSGEGNETTEIARTLEDLQSIDEIRKRLYQICYGIAPNLPRSTRRAVVAIVRSNLKANLQFNVEETNRRINDSIKNVKPTTGLLKKGQSIIREGDTITSDVLKRIEILNKNATSSNLNYTLGVFFLQMFFFLIFAFFLLEYRKILIPDNKSTIVIFTLLLFYLLYSFFLSQTGLAVEKHLSFILLMPLPLTVMIIVVLYNIHLAMIVGIYLIAYTALMQGQLDISVFVLGFSSLIVAAFVNRNVERRSEFMRGGFLIGVANSLLIISIAMMLEAPVSDAVRNVEIAFVSGLMNTMIALGVLPVYEGVLNITTRFKLLELSDLNAEIFKKMLVNAPGTYNHSLLVSTMAESACKVIGANHLLARVGAYYHDIGKIEDSGLYIENRISDPRAANLSPGEYASIIISHLEKGVRLAKENDLPDSVIQFIQEHHSNSTMSYFYHQALEYASRTGESKTVDRKDFQYPGPRPGTRETAIVMIADAVEAASRSLVDPDEEKLEGLVRKIIFNKLNDGDLNYSDLTMSDLDKIADSILQILNGVFHTRIKYPDKEEVRDLEEQIKKGNGNN